LSGVIPTRIVPSVTPANMSPDEVASELRALIAAGARLRPAGEAKRTPTRLLARYVPAYKLDLFDTSFYLTTIRQNYDFRFFVAYVTQKPRAQGRFLIFPRIFYKDLSLVWRAATHFFASKTDFWIGKGDVATVIENGKRTTCSMEATTDLPIEMQSTLEDLSRRDGGVATDERAVRLILRRAPAERVQAYRDFTQARHSARAERRNLVNRGREIATFTRKGDPTSLRFVPGFEPDFARGILEETTSTSTLYGGVLRRFRILSRNRKVQYMFMAAPKHVWIVPPQATTTELSSYGVRTVDVVADDDLFVPGYEYHFMDDDEDPPSLYSQIPTGFAGAACAHDDAKADASAWLDRLPVVREFRKRVLARSSRSHSARRNATKSLFS
jgi:hypothetical protein